MTASSADMIGDTNMTEERELSYPAPESLPATPYPALDYGDIAAPQRQASMPNGSLGTLTSPTMAETAGEYLSLAQYFQRFGGDQQQAPLDSPPVGGEEDGQDEDGDAGEGGEAGADTGEFDDEEEDQDGDEEIQAEEDDPQPPDFDDSAKIVEEREPEQQEEEIWTSLPGFHSIPEYDFSQADPEDAWPRRINPGVSDVSERNHSRGARRGRGAPRGRPRGRASWKWALKGTQHEGMFRSPRITAEAAGVKRRGRGGRPGRGTSRGRQRGGAVYRGPRKVPEGSELFRELQAKATAAFLKDELEAALQYALQAVTESPEIPATHFLMDQILSKQGRHEEALQAHRQAAVALRDAETWMTHGARILARAGDNKTQNDYDAAFRCFAQALTLDNKNYSIRSRKADLFIEMKAYRNAFRECKAMLKMRPGDTETLWKFAELLRLVKDKREGMAQREQRVPRVVEAYRAALDAWRGEPVFGDEDMQWTHVDTYISLLEECGTTPKDCIRELKQIARWLLGREHDTLWDSLDDDREYDVTPERRMTTEFFRAGYYTFDEARYGSGLPLWLRARLGYLRAKMGFLYRTEALRHLDVVLQHPGAEVDNAETFMQTAERLYMLFWYHDAIKFYEAAKDQEHLEGHRFFFGMGTCYKKLDRLKDAERAFHAAVSFEQDSLDARIELARLYAETERKEDAAKFASEITDIGRENIRRDEKATLARYAHSRPTVRPLLPAVRGEGGEDSEDSSDEETGSQAASLGQSLVSSQTLSRRRGKATHAEELKRLQEQRIRIMHSHEVVSKLRPCIDKNDVESEKAARQWMEHAAKMAKEFTSMKVFYPTQPHARFVGILIGKNTETRSVISEMETLKRRMRDTNKPNASEAEALPHANDKTLGDFHDISFQEWHRIIADLALQYARFADQGKCNEMIDALTRANVFRHDFALFNTTLALSIYCAITFNDRDLFLESSRQYLFQGDYRSGMGFQLFAAAGSMGYGDSPFDSDSGKMQQWTSKHIKLHDILVMDPEMRAKWDWTAMEAGKDGHRHEKIGKVNDGLIPGLLATYAHIVTSKQRVHSSSALAYLFRAMALQPDEAVVNLSIATNCIVDALQRSHFDRVVFDRQKLIQQGLGYFYRYYNARLASGRKYHLQEAEYNAARIWDLLGWAHLAAKGYEKVLKLSSAVREEAESEEEEAEDLASDAAFALRKFFIAAENEDAARAIGEEWLVL